MTSFTVSAGVTVDSRGQVWINHGNKHVNQNLGGNDFGVPVAPINSTVYAY